MKTSVRLFNDVLKNMCNVKNVKFSNIELQEFKEVDGMKIHLDTFMDEALRKEALVRELIRKVQETRKKNQMRVEDKISLKVSEGLSGFEELVRKETGTRTLKVDSGLQGEEFEFEGIKINFEVKKAK